MAVSTEVVAARYEDVVADAPISVPFPLYEATDVAVYYGMASLEAVYNTDYSIVLGEDFDTFTLTPTASLIAKIDALIVIDPDETNYITVRRTLNYTTETTPAAVRYTPFTSREFDRTALRFQQLDERLNRALVLSPNFVGDQPKLQLLEIVPGRALMVDATGTAIEAGPNVEELQNAEQYAEQAKGYRDETAALVPVAIDLRNQTEALRDDTAQLKADTTQLKTDTQDIKDAAQALVDGIPATVAAEVDAAVGDYFPIGNAEVAVPATDADGILTSKLTTEFEHTAGQFTKRQLAKVMRMAPYNLYDISPIVGNGVANETAAFRAALAKCKADNRALYIPPGIYPIAPIGAEKYCIENTGVSIFADGPKYATLVPFGNVATDVDFMVINFGTGIMNDFLDIQGIAIWPGYPNFSTTVKGKRGIWAVSNVADINVGKMRIERCYLFPSNDYSLQIENNGTLLPQGCPSNSLIQDNNFWGGLRMTGIGDSNEVLRNVIRAPVSNRCGVELVVVDNGLGSAGHNVFRGNNIDCPGGAFFIRNGRHVFIDGNNMEHSAGAGSSLGAVIDIRGDIGQVNMPEITRNHLGIFGTSTAQRAIAITNARKTLVDRNEFLAGITVPQCIWNRTGSDGLIGGDNSFGTGGWTTRLLNDGGINVRSASFATGWAP